MSDATLSALMARILANARAYRADPEHDAADLALEDPTFDRALDSVGGEVVGILQDQAPRYLASLYDEACRIDEIPTHPVRGRGRSGYDTLTPIEEHTLLFLPIIGPLHEISAFVTSPGRSAEFSARLREYGLLDTYSRIALYPGHWGAQVLAETGPGRLRRILEAAAKACSGTTSPAAHQGQLRDAVKAIVPSEPVDAQEPAIPTIGGRCLILHRIRNGYDGVPEDGRGPLGSDLDHDPLTADSVALRAWLQSLPGDATLMFEPVAPFLTARTLMTIGHVTMQLSLERVVSGETGTGPAECLYMLRDLDHSDALTFAARYGTVVAGPVTVDASLAMSDIDAMMEALQAIGPMILPMTDRDQFDAAIQPDAGIPQTRFDA